MNGTSSNLLELQEHCAILSSTLAHLHQEDGTTFSRLGEILDFSHAAEWLELAAGVTKVEVVTARFDDTVMYCESALEYENARSELYSRIVTQLTIFQFAWGAFETTAKIANPLSIPASFRHRGANGLMDRIIFFLRNTPTTPTYQDCLNELRRFFRPGTVFAGLSSEPLLRHMGPSGVGINVVRRIRNRLAHGVGRIPGPDGWGNGKSRDPEIIALSTRITLLTIQMILGTRFNERHFPIEVLRDADGELVEEDFHLVLSKLHLKH